MDAAQLNHLLSITNYDQQKTQFLVDGFQNGFDLGYRGPEDIKQESRNLRLTIGNETELWNKVMKEVKEKRYAGPYKQIPFENYIQSAIGLVPKDGGRKTRLIFHLSHPRDRSKGDSVNGNTPEYLTKVNYKTFDDAVVLCLKEGPGCYLAKSDMTSAFRHLAMKRKYWKYLVMKAKSPIDHQWYYFVDKCMPFGASISCSHFQEFSDAVAHIVQTFTRKANINYLDDFFFTALLKAVCDGQVKTFLDVCESIRFPVSMEKTFWGCTRITFLGLLIDTIHQIVSVPCEKVDKAIKLLTKCLQRRSKKTTLGELQEITGFLNFLCKAVVPGRSFTRRLYNVAEGAQHKLKKNHHLPITSEMRSDLELWLIFLQHPSVYSRKFIDFDLSLTSDEVDFFTDASTSLGCGGISDRDWFILEWDEEFMLENNPSINYLELYAVTIGIVNRIHKYKNRRVIIFCDNISVVQMINNTTSKCKNCMVLIRIIVLQAITQNVKINAKHIPGVLNIWADMLSRLKYREFWETARKMGRKFGRTSPIPDILHPMEKIWLK